jgi:hypothetical protein
MNPNPMRRVILALAAVTALAGCTVAYEDPPLIARNCPSTFGAGTNGLQLYGTNTFTGLGTVANSTGTVVVDAGTVEFNDASRSATDRTGSLKITLWALEGSYNGGAFAGTSVATYNVLFPGNVTTLQNGQATDLVPQTITARTPPRGSYCMMLALEEFNPAACPSDTDGYCLVDWVQFSPSTEFY